jgi:hypothetical protein
MPFDESPPEDNGGGGDDPRYDPEKIAHIVELAIMQIDINCQNNQVCPLTTRLALIEFITRDILAKAFAAERQGMDHVAYVGLEGVRKFLSSIDDMMRENER